jgi:hypothetical protein
MGINLNLTDFTSAAKTSVLSKTEVEKAKGKQNRSK